MSTPTKDTKDTRSTLTIQEAADIGGVHEATIRRHIKSGRLPAHRFGPRLVRIYAADLAALLEPVHPTAGTDDT